MNILILHIFYFIFIYKNILEYHVGFNPDTDKHITDLDVNKITVDLTESAKSKIISTRIRVARNLSFFPLNPAATMKNRV